MSKRTRPWDKKGGRALDWEFSRKVHKAVEDNNNHDDPEEPTGVPFVEIHGARYWSDRFYLNRTRFDDAYQPGLSSANTFSATHVRSLYHGDCTCGAKRPPPLFDRTALVACLHLKAAIMASFTVDLSWMARALPSLFGPEATVPTLVLHGHKGLDASKIGHHQRLDDDSSEDEEEWGYHPSRGAVNNPQNVPTPSNNGTAASAKTTLKCDETTTAEEAWLQKQHGDRLRLSTSTALRLGPHVHLTQVLPRWLPQPWPKPGSREETADDIQQRRQSKIGVHHPKYMILFETSGSVVVVVSTANLTNPSSTDGSWIQRFEPIVVTESSNKKIPLSQRRRDGSDFGAVLANFIQCQSYAAKDGEMLPEDFLRNYMNFATLEDLAQRYRWEQAQVHLIATVPGEYEGRSYGRHLEREGDKRQRFLYARQRVADIVHELSKDSKRDTAWIPETLISKNDRLMAQPTSFGMNWTGAEMACVARSYMGKGDTNEYLLERMSIVWPTKRLVDTIVHCLGLGRRPSPTSVTATDSGSDAKEIGAEANGAGTYLFLSSTAFNSIDLDCLSQMVEFEPSIPEQQPSVLIPHFKSFARLFEGNERSLRKKYGIPKCEEFFSWFLLTSACLSHGAQGYAGKDLGLLDDMLSYSNFELGVMFCSRLQGKKSTDRLYCWKPLECSCSQNGRTATGRQTTLIHLPLPYCCRGRRFQPDAEEPDFAETPYMHEWDRDSISVGHMRLTPFGATRAAASAAAADN